MKKAKVILAILTAFAFVSGGLAFKARTAHTFYRMAADGNCTSAFQTTLTTITLPGDPIFTIRYATRPILGPCPSLTVKETL